MMIVEIFRDKKTNKWMLDYGIDVCTGKMVILPPEELDCDKQGIIYDIKNGIYYMED